MKVLEGFLAQAKEFHENSPRGRPEEIRVHASLEPPVYFRHEAGDGRRKEDHWISALTFLNLKASLSTNNTG